MRTVSESVSIGHPDKMADYISEALLDYFLKYDKDVRYALEVQIKNNHVTLSGEISTSRKFTQKDMTNVVKNAVRDIGYTQEYCDYWHNLCTNAEEIKCTYHITRQSPSIAVGVANDGWGDQGIFWGMATPRVEYDYMPVDVWLAKKICDELYRSGICGIDIKSQVYTKDGMVDAIVVAAPCQKESDIDAIDCFIRDLTNVLLPYKYKGSITINGTGQYLSHGSVADCGTTGRKLAVDFYGGNCQIGGGSPWTKDYTKADLSLNILARYLAIKYAKEFGRDIKVSIACVIGSPYVEINVIDNNNTQYLFDIVSVKPSDIIDKFNLNTPMFKKICKEGLPYYVINK